jgi:plasmid stabilization system protein ParE
VREDYLIAADAELDLDAIWEYIAEDSLDAADRWIARLFDAFESLARTPGMGHTRQDLTSLPVLFWPVGSYIIIYRIQTGHVEIAGITQGARDIPSFLKKRGM